MLFRRTPDFKTILVTLLVLAVLVQVTYLTISVARLGTTIGSVLRDHGMDRIKENLALLNEDSREQRAFLGLPPLDFPALDAEEVEENEQAGNNAAYFHAVERLLRSRSEEASRRVSAEIVDDPAFRSLLRSSGLVMERSGESYLFKKNGFTYLTLSPHAATGGARIESFFGERLEGVREPDEALISFVAENVRAMDAHAEKLRAAIRELNEIARMPDVRAVAAERGFFFGPVAESPQSYSLPLFLSARRERPRFSIELSKRSGLINAPGLRGIAPAELRGRVVEFLRSVDLRTDHEIASERMRLELESVLDDRGFRGYLASRGLSVAPGFREDDQHIHLDLLDTEGRRIGSFAILKSEAEIYLIDAEGVTISALRTLGFGEAEQKKKQDIPVTLPRVKDLYRNPGERTFLLVGSHERMTDAIIVAHLSEKNNSVRLFGLPRDLFFNNRKINSIYTRYGAERLVRDISAITGLSIDRYVIIDMFAFIDAVNILGGIDVTLKEDLVDPTYRVRVDGRWSTLFYPRGTHRLNGIEALRIARSRHLTSDFGRARRQQDVLAAIKNRFAELGLQDIGRIYELASVLIKYVETDMTPLELATTAIRYANADIDGKHVLDVDNVLYYTYTNLRFRESVPEDENFDKGAYILLPRDNDWNVIRWYIRNLIQGESS